MKIFRKLLVLFLVPALIQAQDFEAQIDSNAVTLEKCLEKGYHDPYMKKCYLKASEDLDLLLNTIYKKTTPLLKKADQIEFRNNQRKWLTFYNSEIQFNQKVFWSQNSYEKYQFGTSVDLSIAANNYEILKNRVETLSN
jgi:uncharacterized protein YecT (DUF1311 family)